MERKIARFIYAEEGSRMDYFSKSSLRTKNVSC